MANFRIFIAIFSIVSISFAWVVQGATSGNDADPVELINSFLSKSSEVSDSAGRLDLLEKWSTQLDKDKPVSKAIKRLLKLRDLLSEDVQCKKAAYETLQKIYDLIELHELTQESIAHRTSWTKRIISRKPSKDVTNYVKEMLNEYHKKHVVKCSLRYPERYESLIGKVSKKSRRYAEIFTKPLVNLRLEKLNCHLRCKNFSGDVEESYKKVYSEINRIADELREYQRFTRQEVTVSDDFELNFHRYVIDSCKEFVDGLSDVFLPYGLDMNFLKWSNKLRNEDDFFRSFNIFTECKYAVENQDELLKKLIKFETK